MVMWTHIWLFVLRQMTVICEFLYLHTFIETDKVHLVMHDCNMNSYLTYYIWHFVYLSTLSFCFIIWKHLTCAEGKYEYSAKHEYWWTPQMSFLYWFDWSLKMFFRWNWHGAVCYPSMRWVNTYHHHCCICLFWEKWTVSVHRLVITVY